MADKYTLVAADTARAWGLELMGKVGLPEEDAAVFIEALIGANLRGVDTHGLNYLPLYVRRLEMGLVAKEGELRILREGDSFLVLDGGNLLGHVAAHRGMKMAIAKAQRSGICTVGIRNSNHCGVMALYTLMAAEASCIGLGSTNAVANMAPIGGREAFFGTNPISIAIPAGEEPPLVLDMATSGVARAKVVAAQGRGEKIPEGWALDEKGLPTTDPKQALKGSMLPLGGHKGFGLAMMVDILSGLLTGAASSQEVGALLFGDGASRQNVGIFLQAIHVDHLTPQDEFKSRIDGLIRRLRSSPTAPGVDKIHLPGDGGRETAQRRLKEGIPLSPYVISELTQLGQRYQLPWPALG